MPYCKLDSGIVYSSIWTESLATRVVFLGMLAIKDHEGFVHGVKSGLARILNVTREQLEEALTVLTSPDPDSRTKDEEGKRVLEVDGGWFVVNHQKYRDMTTDNPSAIKMREHRKRQKEVTKGNALPMLPTEVTPVYVSVSSINKASNVSNDQPAWKTNCQEYQNLFKEAAQTLKGNSEFKAEMQRLYTGIDYEKSIDAALIYWTSEAAWNSQRKKKVKSIRPVEALKLNFAKNKIYLPRESQGFRNQCDVIHQTVPAMPYKKPEWKIEIEQQKAEVEKQIQEDFGGDREKYKEWVHDQVKNIVERLKKND
jgi:hypothetical protein